MPADRRIDAARHPALVERFFTHLLIQFLAHAMQALELETLPVAGLVCHFDHGGDGERVVGRDLRVDAIPPFQHPPGAGEEGNVGGRLCG